MERRRRAILDVPEDYIMHTITRLAFSGVIACGLLAGCEGRPSLFPNSDPALHKTSTQFAADAARRFPYPAGAPRGGTAQGRAEIDVMLTRLQILNYSDQDWKNIDIWVNQSYVCHVPNIPAGKQKVETVEFEMLYNAKGDFFSTNGGKNPINLVEIYRDGKLSQIPISMAD
jgi:hypothetical protein